MALWVQPLDLLGAPVPLVAKARNHPRTALFFNSAAYFEMATTQPFEDGSGVTDLAQSPQSMKANRVPPPPLIKYRVLSFKYLDE